MSTIKELLTVDQLIDHMKYKGIKFKEISEEEAKIFLNNNNYYMKLASYRANYVKCQSGEREGQYQNLDFAYLKELSTLDMYLRYMIMEMALDIEHAIKVKIIRDVADNLEEDGYNIMKKFLEKNNNINILKKIKSHKSGEYCKDLIEKYYPYFPVWVFVELISFGDLLYFTSFYENEYNIKIINNTFMNIVRDLRNASAHSNCILNKMTERIDSTKQINSEISEFVKRMSDVSKQSRKNNLNYKFTYNFICLLYVYDSLMSDTVKQKRYKQIIEFMDGRVKKNKNYFLSNSKIVGVYNFNKKVVDNLIRNTYTT